MLDLYREEESPVEESPPPEKQEETSVYMRDRAKQLDASYHQYIRSISDEK
jgi:hypothetical protein